MFGRNKETQCYDIWLIFPVGMWNVSHSYIFNMTKLLRESNPVLLSGKQWIYLIYHRVWLLSGLYDAVVLSLRILSVSLVYCFHLWLSDFQIPVWKLSWTKSFLWPVLKCINVYERDYKSNQNHFGLWKSVQSTTFWFPLHLQPNILL